MSVLKAITRLFALIGKELVETFRRPGALASLIIGPFLILATFGLGYESVRDPFRTVVVIPPESGLPADMAAYEAFEGEGVDVVAVTPSAEEGRARLADGSADLVVLAPADARERFEAGEQSVIRVEYDIVDPVRASYAVVAANRIAEVVNREIITRVVAQGREYALVGAGPVVDAEVERIPPEVVASPTRAEAVAVSATQPGVVPFYGPAAVALILQHLALTLVALSLVKERTSGVIELFRVSPVSTIEVIAGKVVATGALVAVVAMSTIAVLVFGFGVPLLSGPGPIVAVLGALILASTGVGLFIGVASGSERQAVQLSLFVLLASVFFGGLVLPVSEFVPPVQALAALLPVTHGMALLQDLMLGGGIDEPWQLAALAMIAAVTLSLSWALLRRRMRRI
jgi:ABC-2 type transport system permease protein